MPTLTSDPVPGFFSTANRTPVLKRPTEISATSSAWHHVDAWDAAWTALTSAWGEAVQVLTEAIKPAADAVRQITVVVTMAADDHGAGIRQIAEQMSQVLISRDVLSVPDWRVPPLKLTGVGQNDLLLDVGVIRPGSLPIGREPLIRSGSIPRSVLENEHDPDPAQKAHAVLARDLRVITGLPAGTLGSALGVTREQFQRWVAGKAISPIRHGQLSYLHTIASDLIRRLGEEQARVWWHTPTSEGITPQEMLSRRLIDSVHQLVASLPDASPIVDGVIVALPPQMPYDIENDAPSDLDDVPGPWSPNDGDSSNHR